MCACVYACVCLRGCMYMSICVTSVYGMYKIHLVTYEIYFHTNRIISC